MTALNGGTMTVTKERFEIHTAAGKSFGSDSEAPE